MMKTPLIAALGFLMSTSVLAAEFNFTFAHVLIDETPNGQAALAFAKEVNEKSNGRIEITVLPAAQLGGDVEIIDGTINESRMVLTSDDLDDNCQTVATYIK